MPSVCIRKLIVLRGLVLHGLTAVHSVLQALLLLVGVNSNVNSTPEPAVIWMFLTFWLCYHIIIK